MKRNTLQHDLAILSVTFLLFVFSCVPFHLSASGATYYSIPTSEYDCYPYVIRDRSSSNNPNALTAYVIKFDSYQSEIRMARIYDTSSKYIYYYFVSENPFHSYRTSISADNGIYSCTVGNTSGSNGTLRNGYYVIEVNPYAYTISQANTVNWISDAPLIENNTHSWDLGIYYTFGEGASGGGPDYGDLVDLRFYTNFVNSQQNEYNSNLMRLNKDTIEWDRFEDSNGNPLNVPELFVEIQAYMFEYNALTKSDLLENTILDGVYVGTPYTLYKGSAHVGKKEFTWGEVVQGFTDQTHMYQFFDRMFPNYYENQWMKIGWVYRIRLITQDESYVGDWQIIYNTTSAPPSDSETIYNYYYYYGGQGIDPGVVNSIQNIQYINQDSNNVTSNYYVNGVEIPTSGSNWLETLLKFISDTIGKILDFLGSLFDGFIDLLLGLFDGFDPVGSFFNWWESLKDQFNGIDLTLPEYNLPDEDISELYNLPKATLDIFIDNGLGFVIFIPLIFFILRLFL